MPGNAGPDRNLDRTHSTALTRAIASPATARLIVPSVLLVAALALRIGSFTTDGLDWDESLYVVMAQRWLQGDLPYVAIWDQHPAGLPALLLLPSWLLGAGVVAARIAALLAVARTAAVLARFLARFAAEHWAGVLAAFIYLLYLSRPDGLAANTELFNNLPVTAAAFVLLGEYLRPPAAIRPGRVFFSSLLFGCGLQLKFVVFPEAVLFTSALLLRCLTRGGGIRRTCALATLAIAGGLAPTAAATLYFWQAGALQPYLDANLRANLAYLNEPMTFGLALSRIRNGLLPLAALLPWPLLLAWMFRHPATRRRYGAVGLWLLLWFIAASIDVVLPMKFWKHYFIALIPPLCLATGLAIAILVRHTRTLRWALLTACVALTALPAIGLMFKHMGDSRSIGRINVPEAIAATINKSGSNRHDVYVFNYDPVVYGYLDATPPTRFALGIELAQNSDSSGADADATIAKILGAHPRWLVVADPSPYVYSPATWHALNTALRQYRLAAEYSERAYVQPFIKVRLFEWAPDVRPPRA